MKKKLLVVLMIIVLVPAMLSAKVFGFNVGATTQYNIGVGNMTAASDLTKLANWNFGADLRVKVLVFGITAMGLYGGKATIDAAEYQTISGIVTAGLMFDIADVVRLGIGMGPRMSVYTNGKDWKVCDVNGAVVSNGNAFLEAPMSYRATVDVLLGPVALGVGYIVDSSFSFSNKDWKKLAPVWKEGRLSASVMFNI